MGFRWDWLAPVVPVPYVPGIGPVGPSALSAELFDAVVEVAGTGTFLPYDKERRWSTSKDEQVIVDKIIHGPGRTVIPTLSNRGGGLLKVYCYADDRPKLDDVARWLYSWCTPFRVGSGRVIWFSGVPDGARTRLMLKTFSERDKRYHGPVMNLNDCGVSDTFPAFAGQLRTDGFTFLHQRLEAGLADGPVLVAVDGRRIVGAIGPLAILPDPAGTPTQPPQYFAVHPDYRNRGHGRSLWRAAMAWGVRHGAVYKILQAASESPAERLYLSEGLCTLGFLCSRDIPLA